MCPIGHTYEVDAKSRDILYYTTANGKQPVRKWLESIKDSMTQAILYKRIRQAGMGNFGNTRSVGGTKRTQQADIETAKNYWTHWKKENDL